MCVCVCVCVCKLRRRRILRSTYADSSLSEQSKLQLLFSPLSCPEEEEEYTSESEEEKRAAEARIQKIHKFQGIWKPVTSFTCYFFLHSLEYFLPLS